MAYISRDPFARQELHRFNTLHAGGVTCEWCGNPGRKSKNGTCRLYRYETQSDGGRSFQHNGSFCCKSCHDAYHS